jgi:hypothetical protein
MDYDEFLSLRLRVLRRAAFGLNAAALTDDRVPPEGLFDAAAANGLAAIVAAELPGREFDRNGRVHAPRRLLTMLREEGGPGTEWIDSEVVIDGLTLSQPLRHGGADDEWTHITNRHIDALADLDRHDALQVIDQANGSTFHELVVALYAVEVQEKLPFDLKDRLTVPDPEECPECGRETLIAEGWDPFGVGIGEGTCIACGYERTEPEVIGEAVDRAMERPD